MTYLEIAIPQAMVLLHLTPFHPETLAEAQRALSLLGFPCLVFMAESQTGTALLEADTDQDIERVLHAVTGALHTLRIGVAPLAPKHPELRSRMLLTATPGKTDEAGLMADLKAAFDDDHEWIELGPHEGAHLFVLAVPTRMEAFIQTERLARARSAVATAFQRASEFV